MFESHMQHQCRAMAAAHTYHMPVGAPIRVPCVPGHPCPRLQIVYEFLLRYVVSNDTGKELACLVGRKCVHA